jgi:hypothetical protein
VRTAQSDVPSSAFPLSFTIGAHQDNLNNVAWTKIPSGGVVYSERSPQSVSNPTGGSAGWSNTVVGTGRNQFTSVSMHGPWGNDVRSVHRTWTLGAGVSQCRVRWTSYGMHTRDGEADWVLINDVEKWRVSSHGGRQDDPDYTVSCSGSIKVEWKSNIDQGIGDESWGFNNVEITTS